MRRDALTLKQARIHGGGDGCVAPPCSGAPQARRRGGRQKVCFPPESRQLEWRRPPLRALLDPRLLSSLWALGIEGVCGQIEEATLQVVHRAELLSLEGSNRSTTRVRSLETGAADFQPLDASAGSYIPSPSAFIHPIQRQVL